MTNTLTLDQLKEYERLLEFFSSYWYVDNKNIEINDTHKQYMLNYAQKGFQKNLEKRIKEEV